MPIILPAALLYFAIVFGAGFLLGCIRVPFLVPSIGERWAELAEMPLMATVIFLAAVHVLRRCPAIATPGRSLATGLLALALLVAAELGLAVLLQQRPLVSYILSRDPVSYTVYLAMLLAFASMPRLRLRHAQPPSPPHTAP